MKHTLKEYKQQFDNTTGSSLTKIKAVIEHNMDHWLLEDESLLIDLLDDRNVTAEDIIDTLSAMVSYEEGNAAFKNAVLAMHLGLEKNRLNQVKSVDTDEFTDEQESEFDNVLPFYTNSREELALVG